MASAFGHGYAGFMLGEILYWKHMPVKFWVLSIVCAILPDADALGFFLGVPYGSVFGHRGFSHSILFAAILGLLVTALLFRSAEDPRPGTSEWWVLASYFFFVTLSHALLDAMTTGGLGVAFFAPFNKTRYFFPWRVIQVSPIGVGSFFSEWGKRVILSEALWIGVPLAGVWIVSFLVRRLTNTGAH